MSQIVTNNRVYYRTYDVCKKAGISRSTLFRWMKTGVIKSDQSRDWRGWRLFSDEEVSQIVLKATEVIHPPDW